MLKNLLIITFISLISSFAYAEVKEVTSDMLLGKWNCVNVHLSAKSNGDDKFNYDYKVTDDPFIAVYLKPQDIESYKQSGSERVLSNEGRYIDKSISKTTYNKGTESENYNTLEDGYLYINDNKFIFYQYSAIFWRHKSQSYGHKQEITCSRIK